jgi:hypothetical protein
VIGDWGGSFEQQAILGRCQPAELTLEAFQQRSGSYYISGSAKLDNQYIYLVNRGSF